MHTRLDEIYSRIRVLEERKSSYDGSRSFGYTDDSDEDQLRLIYTQLRALNGERERLERVENANEAFSRYLPEDQY